MLGNHGRSFTKAIFTPLAKLLHRWGVSPNIVTITGTIITCTLAIGLLANGYLAVGGITLGIVLLFDSLDGNLARLSGKSSNFGAFLDSSLDRVSDGVVFSCLIYWAIVGLPEGIIRNLCLIFGLLSLVAGGIVSYVRARGEAYAVVAKVGIAERTDRLIVALVCAGLTDFGLPLWLFPAGLIWVGLASSFTVIQRIRYVYRELK